MHHAFGTALSTVRPVGMTPGLVAIALLASGIAAPPSIAQEVAETTQAAEEGTTDSTPELVPQKESVTIEPYTGPPIFLPEPEDPPAATRVEDKTVTDYYDEETKKQPRVTRTVVKFSDNSLKNDGPYKEFYAEGQLFVEGQYSLGAPTGEWKYFHPDGTPAKTVTYQQGRAEGAVEVRRPDGTLKATRKYAAGKRVGDWVIYGDSGEQALIESHYVEGKPDGVWKISFPDGKQRRQVPFVDGKQHGTVIEWDDEGNKRAEVTFSKGRRDGLSRMWTADGREFEQEYEEGTLVSTKEVKD